jgi:hypothetical protein
MAGIIIRISIDRASDEAVQLWALASAQYPKDHGLILDATTTTIIEVISAFALNARRALEILPPTARFTLQQSRWDWKVAAGEERVSDFRDALNRIIHAQQLGVRFVDHAPEYPALKAGALVVPYIEAATDRKSAAFIDPFALAHAFLYAAFPKLTAALRSGPSKSPVVKKTPKASKPKDNP